MEALYVLAVTTGLRQGELLGLRCDYTNAEAGTLSVRYTLSSTRNGPQLVAPKTPKSRRSVKLTNPALEVLERHQAAQEEKIRLGSLWTTTVCGSGP